ncbi:MAG: metalloregulator ArsR/SmtB family transcription factor [Pseudomonadota bacterium]
MGGCARTLSELDTKRQELADRLAAIAHPHRLQILEELGRADCVCCGEVVSRLPIAQSTVSQHLKILAQAGLVEVNAAGQKSLYRVNAIAVQALLDDVASLRACCNSIADSAPDIELPKDT